MANYFEKVSRFDLIDLPIPRYATSQSAGVDLAAAEDIIVPSYEKLMFSLASTVSADTVSFTDMEKLVKEAKAKPTLVSTGMKCHLDEGYYLELCARSSTPLKHWLFVANGVGVVDADYYNCEANEGEIYVQLINLSPIDIKIQRGDKIAQGIIKKYEVAAGSESSVNRFGGFGSTSK